MFANIISNQFHKKHKTNFIVRKNNIEIRHSHQAVFNSADGTIVNGKSKIGHYE